MVADSIRLPNLQIPGAVRALLGFAILNCLVSGCSSVDQQNRWVYSCPDGYRFDVRFSADGESAELRTAPAPDAAQDRAAETMRLRREVSASGARYSDGTTVLWTKGIMAMIEVDSEILHRDCQGDSDPMRKAE